MKAKIAGSKPALFLDLDNTVRYCTNPKKQCPDKPSEVEIYPGVVTKIKNFKKAGFYIFGVSNQGGVELGYLTENECQEIMKETNKKMDNVFDSIIWASKMVSHDRKPNPGMIEQLTSKFNIDLNTSIMVGDKDSDLMCSLNAGVKQFFYAKDFFVEGHKYVEEKLRQGTLNFKYLDLTR